MKTNAELLKEELMERYGLREDQVRLQVTICTTDLDLGRQILKDFDLFTGEKDYLPVYAPCDMVYGEQINTVYVHRKDGFYGAYAEEVDLDDEE